MGADHPHGPAARHGHVRRHRVGAADPGFQPQHGHLLQRHCHPDLPRSHRPQGSQLPRVLLLVPWRGARDPGRQHRPPRPRVRRHRHRRGHLLPDRRRRPLRGHQCNSLPAPAGRHRHRRRSYRACAGRRRLEQLQRRPADGDRHGSHRGLGQRLSARLSEAASRALRRRRGVCGLAGRPRLPGREVGVPHRLFRGSPSRASATRYVSSASSGSSR